MAAEWQGRAFNATGQPPQLKMLMKLAQTVEVDRAVVHPDALNQVGDCGRPLDTEEGLVDQIEYVAHFPEVLFFAWLRCQAIQLGRIRLVCNRIHPVRGGLD